MTTISLKRICVPLAIGLVLCLGFKSSAAPNLALGVWTDITPSWLKGTSFQTNLVTVDPGNPNTLYLTASFDSKLGLVKSTDRGSTWTRVGNPPASANYSDTVDYLDSPYQIEVDPDNPNHMYCTEMGPGGGQNLGFWVTTNGGAKWVRTKGFTDACKTVNEPYDAGHFMVDPTDFNHAIVSFHYYWNNDQASGVFETKDGGNTFIIHYPVSGMSGPSKAIGFLWNPALGIGNKDTWLLVEDGTGMWRTSDAGSTWTKVFSGATPHGGTRDFYYTPAGVLYIALFGSIYRSHDNGKTWEKTANSPYTGYYTIAGDGTKIYSGPGGQVSGGAPWYSSSVTDGDTWAQYTVGTLPNCGAVTLRYDPINHIMYSANGTGGLWALKVNGQTESKNLLPNTMRSVPTYGSAHLSLISNESISAVFGSRVYTLRGQTSFFRHSRGVLPN